ncbi:MAG: ribosome maturation factor RimP [Deltaproteobacteria bacterium]|nr:ribosome maturation factor RimP [Deltaproteobacteria bacterium]
MDKAVHQTLESLILPIIRDFGFELVELDFKTEGRSWLVRIFIDKPGGVTLDDCVSVSREVEAVLEVEDPIKNAYRLEVSSPGLDRPLKKPADFIRFAGKSIKVKTRELIDPDGRGYARKTFTGCLVGIDGDLVKIEQTDRKGGFISIRLSDIAQANLEIEL